MNKGFTLLELLIAIGIALVLSGGIFAGYERFNKNERLRQAGATLKSNVRLAQTKAISGEKPASGCSQLLGYGVSFTNVSYTIQAQCSEGFAGPITRVTLPTSVTIPTAVSPIVFGVLTGGVPVDVTIILTSGSSSFPVTVARSGDINEGGLQQN